MSYNLVMYNFAVAQIFGVIGIVFSVLSMQMKTKRSIMLMLLGLNLASALNFLFLDSISGSLVSFFAVFETLLNYYFDSHNKKIPIFIIVFYIVVNIALGVSTFAGWIDILPIICALIYCATICVKREATIRKLMFGNQLIWLVYDITVQAYLFGVSNVLTMISIIISMIRFKDFKKVKTTKKALKR